MHIDADNRVVISAPADISGVSLEQFGERVGSAIAGNPKVVAIDCSELERVTSEHVKYLWSAYSAASEAGIQLYLESPSRDLLRVLEVLDLSEFFISEDTLLTRTFTDEFPADTPGIDTALDRFCNFLASQRLPEFALFELKTIFYEVVTNIKLHARLEPGSQIVVSAKRRGGRMTVTFTDRGESFDLTETEPIDDVAAAGDRRQTRGFGITMIRRLADSIQYERHSSGVNIVTVEKRWS